MGRLDASMLREGCGRLLRAICREDFQPAAVGILDEVDAHALVHEAHAAHLLVQGARGVDVVHLEGQVSHDPSSGPMRL